MNELTLKQIHDLIMEMTVHEHVIIQRDKDKPRYVTITKKSSHQISVDTLKD